MSDYSDVPQINTLFSENERVNEAIAVLNSGIGQLVTFTVSIPPDKQTDPITVPNGPVQIIVYPPDTDPSTVTALLNLLNTKSSDIQNQLAALGVTNPTPPPTAHKLEVTHPPLPVPPSGATGGT